MSKKPKHNFVLVLTSQPQKVAQVEPFLRKVNRSARLDKEKFNKLLVVTTEAVNNGILHGNKQDPKKEVVLTCNIESDILEVRIHDEGPGFDADSLPDPLSPENLFREHGRGVFLMRSMMESVHFERTDAGADVVMKMKLE